MSIHGPQWDRDEEYRQSVIRKALLLGFSCSEYGEEMVINRHVCPVQFRTEPRFKFMFDGMERDAYKSIYSAAYDYLRLSGIPIEVIGDYRG